MVVFASTTSKPTISSPVSLRASSASSFAAAVSTDSVTFSITLPIHTGLGLNDRSHWAARAAKTKAARQAAYLATKAQPLPCVVTITRLSAGELDDDNLRGASKAARDGVADRLGVNDRDPRVTWQYAQERAPRGTHAVRIEIAPHD